LTGIGGPFASREGFPSWWNHRESNPMPAILQGSPAAHSWSRRAMIPKSGCRFSDQDHARENGAWGPYRADSSAFSARRNDLICHPGEEPRTSCPALCRASTSSCARRRKEDVDGRDKPGHDDAGLKMVRTPVIETGSPEWRSGARPSSYVRESGGKRRSRTSRRRGIAFTAQRRHRPALGALPRTEAFSAKWTPVRRRKCVRTTNWLQAAVTLRAQNGL
jgi:hypothetical protein